MSYYDTSTVDRERKLIKESTDLTEEVRDLILTFDKEIEVQRGPTDRFSSARHYTLLCNVRLLGERTDQLPDVIIEDKTTDSQQAAKAAGEGLVKHIKRSFRNGYTRDTKISCLRVFIELIGDQSLIPEFSEVFKAKYSNSEDPTPPPGTIVRWGDDVVPMICAANRLRDKAIIAVQWSSGCRPMSELYELTYGQLVDRGDHFIITTGEHTKTGERDVRIFVGAPYLRKWLQKKSVNVDGGLQPQTRIWTHHESNEAITYGRYSNVFDEHAKEAGISKPTNPQHFRASRASILASREHVTQADLEVHFGWERGSNAAAHYVSRFGGETARHIAKADGVVVETDIQDVDTSRNKVSLDTENDGPIAPIVCPNCEAWTPRHREKCLWCPTNVTVDDTEREQVTVVGHSEEAEQARGEVVQWVANGNADEEDLKKFSNIEEAIREYPGLIDDLEKLQSLMGD